jgi:hypothetical protein
MRDRTGSRFIVPFAFLSLIGAGCGGEQKDPDQAFYTLPDEATLAEESRYMQTIFEEKVGDKPFGFMRVDLSDDKQYQFMVHRLLASGNTLENAPRLFAGVQRMRAEAQARVKGGSASDGNEPIQSASSALTGGNCGQFIDAPVSLTANGTLSNMKAKVKLTCFGGINYPYSYADLTTYETDEAESFYTITGYEYVESYDGAMNVQTLAVESALTVNSGKYHFTDSLAYAEDADGNPESLYASEKKQAINPNPVILSLHPKEFNGGPPIRSCIARSSTYGNGDCDYAAVDAGGTPAMWNAVGIAKMTYIGGKWVADPAAANRWFPWTPFVPVTNLYLPLAGTFDAGSKGINGADCKITKFLPTTSAVLTLKSTGGWCYNKNLDGNPTADLLKNLEKNIEGKEPSRSASYNVLADFGKDCTYPLQDVELFVKVAAESSCGNAPRIAFLSKDYYGPLDFKNSCFAEGTGVLRSDGRYVAAEAIKVGEKLIADSNGLALTVTSITRGGEPDPMVHLFDSRGHSVLLTAKHPVVTSLGIVPAEQVIVESEVQTEDGSAVITAVERVSYDGAVYNFDLGTAEELARVKPSDRTMFAGGIRVGDNNMQFEMERESVKPRQREIPAAWLADYHNDVSRRASLSD